jgi:hypothetical protein
VGDHWALLVRHQTLNITSDQQLLLGASYRIPLHRKKSARTKL